MDTSTRNLWEISVISICDVVISIIYRSIYLSIVSSRIRYLSTFHIKGKKYMQVLLLS